ncbi:sulfur carrier protein ThiS [Porifericola rhodea]|uniref:sulfur carrier protein ThiS n=1 Tax=Porifericola rhodea TaxID=930972 RepID=UPI00266513F7|nr:sulfur carrier protein ThiS [Porifericola rhodea]WKN32241.1 sulfur carrier protein ThiS [Porifericola rhodea]
MELLVNNKPYVFDSTVTLSRVLQEVQMLRPTGIAIAVNDEVVPKTKWDAHPLRDRDRIIIIQATQGG